MRSLRVTLPITDTWVLSLQQAQVALKHRCIAEGVDFHKYFECCSASSASIHLLVLDELPHTSYIRIMRMLRNSCFERLRLRLCGMGFYQPTITQRYIGLGLRCDDLSLPVMLQKIARHIPAALPAHSDRMPFVPIVRLKQPLPVDFEPTVRRIVQHFSHQEYSAQAQYDIFHVDKYSVIEGVAQDDFSIKIPFLAGIGVMWSTDFSMDTYAKTRF
ncbi:MAG: hypothetical protein VX112_00420 [Pseudomonadota bacterium]|nr:hypothetical protein [Pseudomonadota bacterium]